MSTANGLKSTDPAASQSALGRCAANVMAALRMLARPPRIYPRSSWSAPRRLALSIGGALLLFLLLLFLLDARAIKAVTELPSTIAWSFDQITDFGKSGWFLWPLGILFLLLAAVPNLTPMSRRVLAAAMVRVGFLFAAIGAPGFFATIVKRIIGRARPLVGGSLDPYLFSPLKWSVAYAALPSGHATTAFAVLVALGALWPRARLVLWIYAVLIAASRVVVTAHYPSDVLAGALVGTVGALMVRRYFAVRRLGFSVAADGRVRRLPGPSLKRIKAVARELLAP